MLYNIRMFNNALSGGQGHRSPNLPDHNSPIERNTGRRYNLSNADIGSVDRIIPHPSGNVRVIEYPAPNKLRTTMRDSMINKKLIIGSQIDDTDGLQTFRIPLSARPIAYEASQTKSGEYTYNDSKMFYDLGVLFRSLARAAEKDVYVVKESIGMLVAIVDFTKEGELPLGFVPGVEKAVYPLHTVDDALAHYDYQLASVFGELYIQTKDSFLAGFEKISEE